MKKKREEFKKVDRNVHSNINNLLYESIKMNEKTKFPLSTCLFPFTPRKKSSEDWVFSISPMSHSFLKKRKKLKVSTTIGYSEVIKRVSFADFFKHYFIIAKFKM